MERVIGYVLRVRKFVKQQQETPNTEVKSSSFLTTEELNESELIIWRQVQRQQFAKDYVSFEQGNNLLDRSTIAPLVPFKCDGLIRARGRIRRASTLSFEQKHPIILSSQPSVGKLFLIKVHSENFMKWSNSCDSFVTALVRLMGTVTFVSSKLLIFI